MFYNFWQLKFSSFKIEIEIFYTSNSKFGEIITKIQQVKGMEKKCKVIIFNVTGERSLSCL
jgi:hypothetical protein